jgi:hypothetical protein
MQLASLDHRVVKHADDCLAQRLGTVQTDQHRAGYVQAAFPQIHQQVVHQGRVLRRALHQSQRVLGPVDVDPESHNTARFGEVHAFDHQRHQIQPGQIRGEQLGQRRLGHRHKTGYFPHHRPPHHRSGPSPHGAPCGRPQLPDCGY